MLLRSILNSGDLTAGPSCAKLEERLEKGEPMGNKKYYGESLPPKTPLQQAESDYNIACGEAKWWKKKADREYKKFKAELEKQNNCQCCPTCGKEK